MRLSKEELQRLIDDYHTELRLLTYRSGKISETLEDLEKQERAVVAQTSTGLSVRRAAKKVARKSAKKAAKKAAKRGRPAKKAAPKKAAKKATKKTAKKAAKKATKKAAKRGRPARKAAPKKAAKKAAKRGRKAAPKKAAKKTAKKAAKRGRKAAPKKAAKKTAKKAAKRGRKAAPRKAAKKSTGGYRLNVWDEIVLKTLGSKSEGVFADFYTAAKRTSAGKKMSSTALYARINQSLHKLANKRGVLTKVKHEGRGFGYKLS
jgi:hypothetical protein